MRSWKIRVVALVSGAVLLASLGAVEAGAVSVGGTVMSAHCCLTI